MDPQDSIEFSILHNDRIWQEIVELLEGTITREEGREGVERE